MTSVLLRMLICNFPELDPNPSRMGFKWEEISSVILEGTKILWHAGQHSDEEGLFYLFRRLLSWVRTVCGNILMCYSPY